MTDKTPKRLKEARELIGYSINKAAKKSNINPDRLYSFEGGTQEPKFSELAILAEIYKRTTEDLMSDTPIVGETFIWD